MLNIRVKYTGGVVAYFNGRKVARFNLEDNFDSDSKSIAVHNQDEFSKFHVIMTTVGGVTGKNIMAFEVHLPVGQSSSSPVVFDATGVFGVNDCSILVDTYTNIDGSAVQICDMKQLQPNIQGTYLEWAVENLEGMWLPAIPTDSLYFRLGSSGSECENNGSLDLASSSGYCRIQPAQVPGGRHCFCTANLAEVASALELVTILLWEREKSLQAAANMDIADTRTELARMVRQKLPDKLAYGSTIFPSPG